MKKLALILFGLSNGKIKHWRGKVHLIDYKKSFDNYKKYIYDYFESIGYEIDIYLCTNKFQKKKDKEEFLDIYKPINYNFIKNIDNKKSSRNTKILNAVKCCLDSKNQYDHCIITRFDLLFKKEFSKHNLNFNKLNLVSKLEKPYLVCDNFYFMPFSFLEKFKNIIENNFSRSFHHLKRNFEIKFGEINYICNENKCIALLSFYKIVRTIV